MTTYTNISPDSVQLHLGDVFEYTYTGDYQSIKCPLGVYKVECLGAGGATNDLYKSGNGGYTLGTLTLLNNTNLHVYVGEQSTSYKGGWNGGGDTEGTYTPRGGCGSSDIRLIGGLWDDIPSLLSRIMVAGGGGGCYLTNYPANGGDAGGLFGVDGGLGQISSPGRGGTQTSGGAGSANEGYTGEFGKGGAGMRGGGGGSGYYGGGSGGVISVTGHSAGGGGSSFISGMESCDAVDESGIHTGQSIHYSGIYFTDCKMQPGINIGHGCIRITYIQPILQLDNVTITPEYFHSGFIEFKGTTPSDNILKIDAYAVYINNIEFFSFRKVINNEILFAIPSSLFNIGNNRLLIILKSDDNRIIFNEHGIPLINQLPNIDISIEGYKYVINIDDFDKDDVKYKLILNGKTFYESPNYVPTPLTISDIIPHHLVTDDNNVLSVEAVDTYGGKQIKRASIYHVSHGLLFFDALDNIYTDCYNLVHQSLEVDPMFGGQTSPVESVFLKNCTNVNFTDINVYIDSIPDLVDCKLSLDQNMTNASSVLTLPTPLMPQESVELFVQVLSNKDCSNGGIVKLKANGQYSEPINVYEVTKHDTLYDILNSNDFIDGYYTLNISNGIKKTEINVQIVNFYSDSTFTSSLSIGDVTNDETMLILIFHGNLTIEKDIVLTPLARKKGLTIFCKGNITNNGIISMTARGASAEGQDVYLYGDEYVPAVGADGGEDSQTYGDYGLNPSPKGKDGFNRQTGGGGTGGINYTNAATSLAIAGGGKGTSYSGGTGGGGCAHSYGNNTQGFPNGGQGGTGYSPNGSNIAAGGTGNPGGIVNNNGIQGNNGTGGLLIIYAHKINNSITGIIESQGIDGAITTTGIHSNVGGGASGGGSINIFYKTLFINNGVISAKGGYGKMDLCTFRRSTAGDGGDGCVTIQQM